MYLCRVCRSHFADRIFHGENMFVAYVAPQHTRERAVRARMRIPPRQRAFRLERQTVGPNRYERLLEGITHVLFIVVKIDGWYRSPILFQQEKEGAEGFGVHAF